MCVSSFPMAMRPGWITSTLGQISARDVRLNRRERRLLRSLRSANTGRPVNGAHVEPRKGHLQVLEAMQLLWQDGSGARLIIAGKQGWNVENWPNLCANIRSAASTCLDQRWG